MKANLNCALKVLRAYEWTNVRPRSTPNISEILLVKWLKSGTKTHSHTSHVPHGIEFIIKIQTFLWSFMRKPPMFFCVINEGGQWPKAHKLLYDASVCAFLRLKFFDEFVPFGVPRVALNNNSITYIKLELWVFFIHFIDINFAIVAIVCVRVQWICLRQLNGKDSSQYYYYFFMERQLTRA